MPGPAPRRVQVIDSHTGGEPTRLVIGGGPDIGRGPLDRRRDEFRLRHDDFRAAVVMEPRGSDVLVGALLCEPEDRGASAGVIFFNNIGCLGMCGHGTIGLVVSLAHLGRIGPGEHRIETPVGEVTATLGAGNAVTVRNVPSYRLAHGVKVEVEGRGPVTGDIAWGGNWFFLTEDHRAEVRFENLEALLDLSSRIRRALAGSGITGAGGEEIDHIELLGPPSGPGADGRNFVLCPGGAYDRSPCGTGTSAKLACLAADGKLRAGEVWRQESIVGSVFEGRVEIVGRQVVPSITGTAFVTAEATLLLDPADPFAMGLRRASAGRSILIVGGGVIGMSAAYYSLRKGHRVTVIERGGPDHDGCSLGNAGMVTPSHFVPLAAPGMVAMGLKMMFRPTSPFSIRPRLDADLLRWGWKFCRSSTARHVERSAPLLCDLGLASRRLFEELAEASGNEFGLVKKGLLMLCGTEKMFREEVHTAEMAGRLGIPAEVMTPEQAARLEPALRMDIRGAVYFPKDCHLVPQRFMAWIAREVERQGGRILWSTEVTGLRARDGRVESVRSSRGDLSAEEYLLAAGSWSPALSRALDLDLPLQAGKGYSITLPAPRRLPEICSILAEARVAVTPMAGSLRFAGTLEISGLDRKVNPERFRGLLESIPRYFPELRPQDFLGLPVWSGLRPCSPDGLPYVGRASRYSNLSVACGHAMQGLSQGPITGLLISEIFSGEKPSVDLELLRPDRFAR